LALLRTRLEANGQGRAAGFVNGDLELEFRLTSPAKISGGSSAEMMRVHRLREFANPWA